VEKNRPSASRLWEYINNTNLSRDRLSQEFKNFKSTDINFKLAIWNPRTNGIRFLKTLIFFICSALSGQQWGKLKKIHNREVGNPYSIQYNNEHVCLDYLQAVFEIDFMEKYFNFKNSSVIEIGAGYGRTCHAVLSNYNINNYYIIDLTNSLELCQYYLKIVLNKTQYNKITFVNVEDFDKVRNKNYDLCVNVDSLAEMEEATVRLYLQFIDSQCENFYVKNPVGKYCDKSLISHDEPNEVVDLAMETGILKEVIDIHNNKEIEMQSREFVKAYCPSNKWECVGNEWGKPWSYYWQAFFRRNIWRKNHEKSDV